MNDAARLDRVLKAAGVPIVSVSIGRRTDKSTWTVQPSDLQAAAQPIIDAFDPNDPAHRAAEVAAQVTAVIDTERLPSAVVWTILRQMYPTDTVEQTKTKCGVVWTRIIDACKAEPWK